MIEECREYKKKQEFNKDVEELERLAQPLINRDVKEIDKLSQTFSNKLEEFIRKYPLKEGFWGVTADGTLSLWKLCEVDK